ncbi:MAG: glycosyltransferase [Kiloniellales bacterium]
MVSVVLVTYNHEAYLKEAIESIIAQKTRFNFEIIISEDCSTDSTRDIVESYVSTYPKAIRALYSKENLNTNEVTTRAIRAARGKYIAFLDGDDYWTDPRKLQLQVRAMQQDPELSITYHNARQVDADGKDLGKLQVRPETFEVYDLRSMLMCNPIPGASPLIRAKALQDIPAWFHDFDIGDWPLYLIAAQHGLIQYLDRIMCVYRIHPKGYWQSVTAKDQARRVSLTYDKFAEVMPKEYERHIRAWQRYWERYPWW